MAEAAAPSAPAAPGTALPNSGTPVPVLGTSVTDSPGDGIDSTVRLAKPIRPIPRLPGVFPDGDDPFSPESADRPATGTASPPRDAFGRFVAPSSATPSASGEHTPEPASAPDSAAEFEFAGERFPSREAAEQNFKSLRGQYKPLQGLAKQLGGVQHVVPRFVAAAESARGWKAAHDNVQAELQALRGAAPAAAQPQPVAPSTPQPTDATPAEVDWDLYAEVKKLATERGEPWKAEQWLMEQVRTSERAHYEKLLNDRFAPLDAAQQAHTRHAEVTAQTETLFGNLIDYTLDNGSPAFPELHDEASAREIGSLWASLGLPRAHALTPQGAIAAIALYRMNRAVSAPQAGAAAPTPAPQPPHQPSDARSASTLTDGRQTVTSVPGDGPLSPSAEAERIKAALRSVHSPNRAMLGFDA